MGNPLLDARVTGNSLWRARIYSHQKWKWIPLITSIYIPFSGGVAILQRAPMSFVMPVIPSVRLSALNTSVPTKRKIMKVDIW